MGNTNIDYKNKTGIIGLKEDTKYQEDRFSPNNQLQGILLKMLIPAYAAGALIGKSGQTITELQKQTGVSIKLSKAKDYYPGTMERVVLIQGKAEGIEKVMQFTINRV